jgi:glycerol uptake facilitator-like aquaporin
MVVAIVASFAGAIILVLVIYCCYKKYCTVDYNSANQGSFMNLSAQFNQPYSIWRRRQFH